MKSKNVRRPISYDEVKDLLSIVDDRQWDGDGIYPPYELRTNGIFAKTGFRHPEFSLEMQEVLRPWFPPEQYGNYDEPVVPLPCEPDDFIEFITGADLWDRVILVDGTLVDLWSKLGLPSQPLDCPDTALVAEGVRKHPPLIKPANIAAAFSDLKWGAADWKKYLSDPAKWMLSAQKKTPGLGRNNPNLWNPIDLAKGLMHHQPDIDLRELDRRFKTRPELAQWRSEWETGPGSLINEPLAQ